MFFQLLARLGSKPVLTALEPALFPEGPSAKGVYEFYGEEGSGKNQMLLHLLANAILPAMWDGVTVGGHAVRVIYIDLVCHFNVIRLATILESRIRRSIERAGTDATTPSTDDVEALIKSCLSRLYLVRCSSNRQLLITLHSLDTLLSNKPDLCVMMISSISAFYWLDRSVGGNKRTHDGIMTQVAAVLEKLVSVYSLVLFCTKSALFQGRTNVRSNSALETVDGSREATDHAEYMCKAWQKLVTHRFVLVRKEHNIIKNGQMRQLFLVTVNKGNQEVGQCKYFEIQESGVCFIA